MKHRDITTLAEQFATALLAQHVPHSQNGPALPVYCPSVEADRKRLVSDAFDLAEAFDAERERREGRASEAGPEPMKEVAEDLYEALDSLKTEVANIGIDPNTRLGFAILTAREALAMARKAGVVQV